MSPEHIAQVWAAIEVKDLERLAALRAAPALRRLEGLEALMTAVPGGDYHAGAMQVLRNLVLRAGCLVTAASLLAEVEAEIYEWAKAAGWTPRVTCSERDDS